jgi:hypothetical protein
MSNSNSKLPALCFSEPFRLLMNADLEGASFSEEFKCVTYYSAVFVLKRVSELHRSLSAATAVDHRFRSKELSLG